MKSALLVIDVQQFFINKYTKRLPQKIADFIDDHQFDYTLFFKFVNTKTSNWVKKLGWKKMINPSETELVPELKGLVTKDNLFIKKAAFSAFRAKGFESYLKDNKITKLFICGLDTNACVYMTAMEAFELGLDVKVIEDLCLSHSGKQYHKNSIDLLKRNLGAAAVLDSRDIKT